MSLQLSLDFTDSPPPGMEVRHEEPADRFGGSIYRTAMQVDPKQMAQWRRDGTLDSRLLRAAEKAAKRYVSLASMGMPDMEAVSRACADCSLVYLPSVD